MQNGLKEAELILEQADENSLKEDFHNYYLAINALKHGDGVSYANLVGKSTTITFLVDTPTIPKYEETDVSGIVGLVRVDDTFIKNCLELIGKVSGSIATHRPGFTI